MASALNKPEQQPQAGEAIRDLIEKIVLTPGAGGGGLQAPLDGEFNKIAHWVQRLKFEEPEPRKKQTPEAFAAGVSIVLGAGTGFEPVTFRL